MKFLDLPDDLIAEILRWLDEDSVYTCSLVNKGLRAYLHHDLEFEYRYRLAKHQLVDTCHGRFTYEQRIHLLKHFTWMWWSDIGSPKEPYEAYRIEGRCIAYELVAGVFAKTDGSSLTMQWLPSLFTPARQITYSRRKIGFPIKDFALDPTQDLITLIEADLLPNVLPRGREIVIHIKRLSTYAPHPLAKEPTIRFMVPYHPQGNYPQGVTIQLAGDLLSIFFSSPPGLPQLLLWDWKRNAIILNSMTPGLHLPTGTHSFEILSPRSYALLSTTNSGSIHVYNIDYPRNPIVPPFCVARLMMPSLLPGLQLASLFSHTGPFLGQPRRDGIFTTSPDARVFVITARFLNTPRTHATFFINGAAFAPYMQLRDQPSEIPEIPWQEWSNQKCFLTPFHLSTNWLRQVRYVQGTRVVMPMEEPSHGKVAILDFNLVRDPIAERSSNFDLFTEDIRHILPPRTQAFLVNSRCTSWMIDEDYILGLDTEGAFDEQIRSLEVYSMYHCPKVEALLLSSNTE
ncbi:hypothetical protein NP233_g11490 [Leucocoprinus birnbaumii]|uniref:F-box domain-containing protein n=1 Tax=Leucocoprinus birnbaumii TaxID=56174 RepID=A0AAD5VMG0_9AGAR|nr:hypothetical protein NP233_g11490 [Leucocoprinus birnbaumii]